MQHNSAPPLDPGLPASTGDILPAVHARSVSAQTLKSRVARGSAWTLAGYGSSQALRLVNNLILWRLLYPEAFGLMAIVTVCLAGLAMFSDVGIGPSIVQHEHGDDADYLNTAWTIQVIREFLLCSVAFILAKPIASFYHQPQLATLLPAAALASLISGFNSTRLFTLTRSISLGRLTVLDLASQSLGLLTMIIWAWISRSIWALIVGTVVSNLVRMVLSHTFLPGIRNRFRWNPACARALLRFGRWIFASTLLTFVVMQSDRLLFGKLIPMGLLGVYSVATTWAGMPLSVISRIFSAVLFPLLSRLHNEGTDFSEGFLRSRKPWLVLSGFASACLISGGPTLIRLLYEPRAASAGWIIQVLAAGIWLLSLESANGIALLALGRPKWVAIGNVAKLIGMVTLIPLGYSHWGFPGAVVALASTELLHYATSVTGAHRHKVSCFGQDMTLSALVVVTSGAGLLAARWIGPLLQSLALRPAKLGVFLEGVAIAICVGVGWACVYGWDKVKGRRQAIAA